MEEQKFGVLASNWVENKKHYVKESTYANYAVIVENHLIPHLGDMALVEIGRDVIQKLILELRMHGRVDGQGGLADKTVKDIIVVLKMCLRDMESNNGSLCERNVFRFPPNDQADKMKILSGDMCARLLQAIERENACEAMGYAVSLLTGIRIGELCALQWKDVDLEQKVIHIYKTIQRIYFKKDEDEKTKIIIGTPKSRSAIREIPISQRLEDIMGRYVGEGEDYLISGNKKYIEPRLYRKHFHDFLDKNKLPEIRFHDLRHTFATRCIANGGDCKTVSRLLGHADVNITLNRYVHPGMDQKRACVELAYNG